MHKKKTTDRPLDRWAQKIQWGKRVKAVCKPCWEIKYCPYGTLVEDFPLKSKDDRDHRSCRIFGHDCPVYYVAEPFTETKELRNISRSIPTPTKFRVLKRENQICLVCGESVKDEDVEFDHVIPWSKGGSSDEHNVRLLCRDCNRKRGKKFEDEYLVRSVRDHIIEPAGIELAYGLIEGVRLLHRLFKEQRRHPTGSDFCKFSGRRKVRDYDEFAATVVRDVDEFFGSKKPKEMKQRTFKALRHRWGFADGEFHGLRETARLFGMDINALFQAEISFVSRLGFPVRLTEAARRQWLRL